MIRLEWGIDQDQRETVEPLLTRALAIVPPWVQSLYVDFDPETKRVATIAFLAKYRVGRLVLGSDWFACSKDDRALTLVHEITHTHLAHMEETYAALVTALTEGDPKLEALSNTMWEDALEKAVSDISFMFHKLLT